MRSPFTCVAIARNRVHTRSGLWVMFTFSVAIYSVSADTIVLKSGETLERSNHESVGSKRDDLYRNVYRQDR